MPFRCQLGSMTNFIGSKKKSAKRGRDAGSKVTVMIAVESVAKACVHVALSKPNSGNSFACVQQTSESLSG